MVDDQKKDMTILQVGSIKFNLIVRDTLFGIRARDLNSDLVKSFTGIDRFPIDFQEISVSIIYHATHGFMEAHFFPYIPPPIISIKYLICYNTAGACGIIRNTCF